MIEAVDNKMIVLADKRGEWNDRMLIETVFSLFSQCLQNEASAAKSVGIFRDATRLHDSDLQRNQRIDPVMSKQLHKNNL